MEIIGYGLAILIGVSLGLIGSGGSILTIPILVYLMHIIPSEATTYSLFVVGISALVGSFKGAKDTLVDFKMTFYFGVPGIVAIFIMRKFLLPMIPTVLCKVYTVDFTKELLVMLVFAVLMIWVSLSMIFKKNINDENNQQVNFAKIVLQGVFVGLLTGFVGVGGGFLIIPALVFSAKLPMTKAIATSLVIIAANALVGFLGSLNTHAIDWTLLLIFTIFSLLGILLGIYLRKKISNEKLKPIFGWVVLATGIYILIKELFFIH